MPLADPVARHAWDRQYRLDHRVERLEYEKNYDMMHPHRAASWRSHHPDHLREYNKQYKNEHRDEIREQRLYINNAPKYRLMSMRRYARTWGAQLQKISPADVAAKWAYWGDKCWVCGGQPVETDHVKPLSKGGAHMLCNMRPICRSCNARKSNHWPMSVVAS